MKSSFIKVAAVAATLTIALSGCAGNEGNANADLKGTLNAAGSSAMGSAQEAWIAEYQTANTGVSVNYDPTGSGAGREAFFAGSVNFAGSDSSLKDEELALTSSNCAPASKYFEVPVYVSPIAVIFNVDGVTDLNLSSETLAKIFKGTIKKWNDAAIVAENPGVTLPAFAITAVHRSDDSGTTKNFTDYLSKTASAIWDGEVSDVFPYKSGEGAKGTSGVVDAVKNGKNTIGYADASKAGNLGTAKLKVGDAWVAYSAEAAAKIVETSPRVEGREATDMAVKIDRTSTDSSTYPLVLVSYAIGCTEYADAEIGTLVKSYLSYLLTEAAQTTAHKNAGSAPLTASVRKEAAGIINNIK